MANPNPVDNMPNKKGPGRPKGVKNAFPTALKAKVLFAAEQLEAEGKDLGACALKDPVWFWETFVKPMLPKEVNVGVQGKVKVSLTVIKNDGND